jgi:hypothetical protein
VNVFLPNESVREQLRYFTAVLNSKLLWHWFKHHAKSRGIALEINGNVLERAPIRPIDFRNPKDTALFKQVSDSAEQMMSLSAALNSARSPHERESARREAEAVDARIDQLVYSLYGITEQEITGIERSLTSAS